MKIKSKMPLIFIVTASLILAAVFAAIYRKENIKGGEGHDIYTFGSDRTTVVKYDSDKKELGTVVLQGQKREKILKIFRNATENNEYNDKKFDYNYKLDFGNGYIGYIDVNEMILKSEGYFELTESQCNRIESLFD